MRMTLITYRKTFNLGSFQSESIGVEMELNEGESAVVALDNCAALVNEYHSKTLAEMEEFRGTTVREVPGTAVDQTIKGIIEDINACTAIDEKNGFGVQTGLIAYQPSTQQNPEIKAAYDLKFIQLTKK